MVTIRDGRMEQQQKQLAFLLQRRKDSSMFKVPTSSSSSSYQSDIGKRKWQEAFSQSPEAANTRLGLSTTDRPQQKQKLPPLTIFYAGTVNVYDNVPENMVRALMTLAAARSSKPAAQAVLNHLQKNNKSVNTAANSANGCSFPGFQQLNPNVNHGFSSGNSSSNEAPASFTFPVFDNTSLTLNSFANNNNSKQEEKRSPPSVATRQQSPPSTPTTTSTQNVSSPDLKKTRMQLLPAGLPQARRASIQRFLEKRKHKQVNNNNNNNNEEEEDAGNISLKPGSPEDFNTQVPHFLRRVS